MTKRKQQATVAPAVGPPAVVPPPPSRTKPRQGVLPELDIDAFREFVDLSSGMPVTHTCPKCGYSWLWLFACLPLLRVFGS